MVTETKKYMTTKPPLQRFCKEFYTQKKKTNKTMQGKEVLSHRRRKERTQRVALNHLQTLIPLNRKTTNCRESPYTFQY
jgi:hypothetical protein